MSIALRDVAAPQHPISPADDRIGRRNLLARAPAQAEGTAGAAHLDDVRDSAQGHQAEQIARADGIGDAAGLLVNGAADAHHHALAVQQRAAAIARADRRLVLELIGVRAIGDDAGHIAFGESGVKKLVSLAMGASTLVPRSAAAG